MKQTLLLLPGDGIGPEVIAAARQISELVAPDVELSEALVGGASLDASGVPLTDDVLEQAKTSDAVLLGAVGGPKWENAERDKRPEMGLLSLRKELDVFANLRPAFCFEALIGASTLKRDIVEGLDLMIVRELTSGVYFGEPRGIDTDENGVRRGYDTSIYTAPEIERVARVAFEIARGRNGRVCSVDKSNVMESGLFWRTEVSGLHEMGGEGVELTHMLADACAMELVRNPKQFDVILADNLFGDLLSDEASMLTGSIGMLPSASLGVEGTPGLFEPVHGSAPDIAGQNIANPCAAILSLEMALRWSLARPDAADRVMTAVAGALKAGARTNDLGGSLSTTDMTRAVIDQL
ncbi:MAG: 3-isopropylmalate dehydrogenase [Henriciella sp.]|uniref:3-isopropylmalate dehydrogenase n=1 Tax=Henriciella sp. TaxID=1968823 RepID=UPI003C75F7EA